MDFHYIHWKQNQTVAEHYVHSFEKVRELFEYDYSSPVGYASRAQWLDKQTKRRASADALVNVLVQYNERIGNDSTTVQAIRQLLKPDTLVVVGGQQAGLFTGPLLVIHKAISIIRAAKKASIALGRPVLPVFWIAGEDHDIDEVNHIYQLSSQLTIDKAELPMDEQQADKRLTVSRRTLSQDQWEAVLSQLEAGLQQTEFKLDLLQSLRDMLALSDNLSDAFGRIMAHLFGKHGLILLDSDDAALRQVEAPFFHELVEHNEKLEHALFSGKSTMANLGYEALADVKQGVANLFWLQDHERFLLSRSEDGNEFFDKTGSIHFDKTKLLELADSSPASFSNNVFTRPLMQDYLFPVLATVLGPGEIAYWGLTKEAFRAFDMQMPIVIPRTEFTLVEGTVKKQIAKLGLSFEDAVFHLEERKQAWLEAQDSLGISEQFEHVKRQFAELYAPVVELAGAINPGLRTLGETNKQKITEQIEFLENKTKDAFEAQFDAARRQFERIRHSLLPLGKRQERVYNVYAYLNKYGTNWMDQLLDGEYEDNGKHVIVYL